MEYVLLTLAVVMGIVVWWVLRQTVNVKPWVPAASTEAVDSAGVRAGLDVGSNPLRPSKVALGGFLAVSSSIFALFISAYSIRMEYGDWRPLPEPTLLWANTVILILCSVFLHSAWVAVKKQNLVGIKVGLALGSLMTLAFMVGQGLAWNQLLDSGYGISGNPANAFFYTLTALHALHLLGGLIALAFAFKKVWGAVEFSEIETKVYAVELCGVYWHFFLAVWAILFTYLLNT